MGHFLIPQTFILETGRLPFWVPGTPFPVILGSEGSPNRHLEVQVFIFIDLSINSGLPWDSCWAPFCVFSVLWGAKRGARFQIHVSGDPGMEMLPACSCCRCYTNIVKTMVLGFWGPGCPFIPGIDQASSFWALVTWPRQTSRI